MPNEKIRISADKETASIFKRVWWLVLIRGILAIILGIISLTSPLITGIAITIVFGVYALIDGIVGLIHAWRASRRGQRWGWIFFIAIVSILAGLAALIIPPLVAGMGALYFTISVAGYAILYGLGGVFGNGDMNGTDKFWAILAGIATFLAGVALLYFAFTYPAAALLTVIIWVIGIYAIILGIALVVLAFQMRKDVAIATI